MKIPIRCSPVFALFIALSASVSAQIIHFSGQVNAVSGLYAPQFQIGDAVSLKIDLTPPLTNALPPGSEPWRAVYFRPITLNIGGVTLWDLPAGLASVELSTNPFMNGLMMQASPVPFTYINQNFISPSPILQSVRYFPPALVVFPFMDTRGSLQTSAEVGGILGEIDWRITSYIGYGGVIPPHNFSPVPEPAYFGMLAVSGLLSFALFTKRHRFHPNPGTSA